MSESRVFTHTAFKQTLLKEIALERKRDVIERLCENVVGICKENDSIRSSVGAHTLMYAAILQITGCPDSEAVVAKSLAMLRWLVCGDGKETIHTKNAVYLLDHLPLISSVMSSFSTSAYVMKHAIELIYILLRCTDCLEPIFDSGIISTIIDMLTTKLVCTDSCFYYCLAALRNVSQLEKSRPVLIQTVVPFLFENLERPDGFTELDAEHVFSILTNSMIHTSYDKEYIHAMLDRGLELTVNYGLRYSKYADTIRVVIAYCRNYIALRSDAAFSTKANSLIWSLFKMVMDGDFKPNEGCIKHIAISMLQKDMWSVDQLEHALSFLLTEYVITICEKTSTIDSILTLFMHRGPECGMYLRQPAVIDRLYKLVDDNPMSVGITSLVDTILIGVRDDIRKESTGPIEPMEDRLFELTKRAMCFFCIKELSQTILQD
jgi:hypothetical protein